MELSFDLWTDDCFKDTTEALERRDPDEQIEKLSLILTPPSFTMPDQFASEASIMKLADVTEKLRVKEMVVDEAVNVEGYEFWLHPTEELLRHLRNPHVTKLDLRQYDLSKSRADFIVSYLRRMVSLESLQILQSIIGGTSNWSRTILDDVEIPPLKIDTTPIDTLLLEICNHNNIKEVYLDTFCVGYEALKHLVERDRIQKLGLRSCPIVPPSKKTPNCDNIHEAFENNTSLNTLSLEPQDYSSFGSFYPKLLKNIRKIGSLKTLKLDNTSQLVPLFSCCDNDVMESPEVSLQKLIIVEVGDKTEVFVDRIQRGHLPMQELTLCFLHNNLPIDVLESLFTTIFLSSDDNNNNGCVIEKVAFMGMSQMFFELLTEKYMSRTTTVRSVEFLNHLTADAIAELVLPVNSNPHLMEIQLRHKATRDHIPWKLVQCLCQRNRLMARVDLPPGLLPTFMEATMHRPIKHQYDAMYHLVRRACLVENCLG